MKENNTIHFDDNDNIIAKNISAYWIPELTIHKKIGGTHYTVFGTYEGDEPIVGKLERIMSKIFLKKWRNPNDKSI